MDSKNDKTIFSEYEIERNLSSIINNLKEFRPAGDDLVFAGIVTNILPEGFVIFSPSGDSNRIFCPKKFIGEKEDVKVGDWFRGTARPDSNRGAAEHPFTHGVVKPLVKMDIQQQIPCWRQRQNGRVFEFWVSIKISIDKMGHFDREKRMYLVDTNYPMQILIPEKRAISFISENPKHLRTFSFFGTLGDCVPNFGDPSRSCSLHLLNSTDVYENLPSGKVANIGKLRSLWEPPLDYDTDTANNTIRSEPGHESEESDEEENGWDNTDSYSADEMSDILKDQNATPKMLLDEGRTNDATYNRGSTRRTDSPKSNVDKISAKDQKHTGEFHFYEPGTNDATCSSGSSHRTISPEPNLDNVPVEIIRGMAIILQDDEVMDVCLAKEKLAGLYANITEYLENLQRS